MSTRRIRVFNGRLVDPFNLQPEDVTPAVFIHHTAIVNRYTGGTRWPYSVLQHSINLSRAVPRELAPAAFIHDWEESLFNDLAAPVKRQYPDYMQDGENAQRVIFETMGVPWEHMEAVHEYDQRIYKDERDVLYENIENDGQGLNDHRVALGLDPYMFRERYWRDVKADGLNRFSELFPEWRT